jgi:hypothetical protein
MPQEGDKLDNVEIALQLTQNRHWCRTWNGVDDCNGAEANWDLDHGPVHRCKHISLGSSDV